MRYVNANHHLKSITNEIHQGFILGPGLFLIYINDIVNSTSHFSSTDDTTVYHPGSKIENLTKNVKKIFLIIRLTKCLYVQIMFECQQYFVCVCSWPCKHQLQDTQ